MYFFNGFVSFEKPNLYEENSRVKKIKVTDTISSKFIIFNIDDTPNPQLLKLGELKEWELSIEILDVYKGTKYSDTCINAIQCTIFDVKK
ncbi:MAG: hypothetical protein JXR64_02720 [Spirochaetales bacterium]|nr:hypothetical protein [Spirochaetales bacterium]